MAIFFGNFGSNFADQTRIAALEKENRELRDQVDRLRRMLYLEKHKDMPVVRYHENSETGCADELQ